MSFFLNLTGEESLFCTAIRRGCILPNTSHSTHKHKKLLFGRRRPFGPPLPTRRTIIFLLRNKTTFDVPGYKTVSYIHTYCVPHRPTESNISNRLTETKDSLTIEKIDFQIF